MKNIIYLIVLLLALPILAQDNKNTITVIGETDKNVLSNNYTVLIALQQIMVYEGQTEIEATSLEDVENNFIKKLKTIGIDFNRFKSNIYYEFAMAYSQSRASAYYYFKTTNKDEVRALIQLKSAGMSITNIDIESTDLTDQQLADLSVKAIANAREKATTIANKLNKTIGDIVNISDQNTNKQYVQSYGTTTSQTHDVIVSFELN